MNLYVVTKIKSNPALGETEVKERKRFENDFVKKKSNVKNKLCKLQILVLTINMFNTKTRISY